MVIKWKKEVSTVIIQTQSRQKVDIRSNERDT